VATTRVRGYTYYSHKGRAVRVKAHTRMATSLGARRRAESRLLSGFMRGPSAMQYMNPALHRLYLNQDPKYHTFSI
jgi:hypothetical protein